MTSDRGFAYRALRADGSVARGAIVARDRDAASAELSARGLFPLRLEMDGRPGRGARRMSAGDLALGLRMLATLVDAGLPMRRVSGAFATVAPGSWAPVVAELDATLRTGRGLSAALAAAPVRVPAVVVGIIRAGDGGGGLAPALRAAAELAEQSAATQSTIRAALAYPAVLALAGAGSVFVLVGIVLPRFAAILADLGQALPPTTRFVLAAAAAARGAAMPALVVVAAGGLGWQAWRRGDRAAEPWSAFLLAFPLVGPVRRSAASARVAASLAALLGAGVPIAAALHHAASAAGDTALELRLRRARESVIAGASLAAALDQEGAATATMVRLVRAGEESGELAAMLSHASRLEADQATARVRRIVRLLEPTMILVFAAMVALVAAALLQAVYAVRPA